MAGGDAGGAERKIVTVLFCDLVGSTALGDRLDPEALQAVLAAYFDRMRAIAEHHGGIVEKFIGDAVVSVFGMPTVHEDDAERAVRCALAMRDALAGLNDPLRPRFGVELAVRMGVNSGMAVASGETLAPGDAVNVSARLERAAAPGEILVGRDTMALTREVVVYGEPRELSLAGKPVPELAWPALELASRRARVRSWFVGRAPELEALTESLEQAIRERTPRTAVVLGEPGIGKTRLVEEFAARATGRAACYAGSCRPYGESSPLQPLGEILRTEVGVLDLDPPPAVAVALRKRLEARHDAAEASLLEAQLAPLLGAARPSAPSGPELVWALRRYLERLALAHPTAIVLDNLQWAAQALLDTVFELADTVVGAPLFLVCLGRPELREGVAELLGQERCTLLVLRPLAASEGRTLLADLRRRTAAAFRDDVEDAIVRRSQGNPLFLEEIAAAAAEEGDASGVPTSLRALISARLDLLPPTVKAVAQCAAAVGEIFWDEALRAACVDDASTVGSALRLLRTRGFIEEEPASTFVGARQFRFHHALIREVAYASIPVAERRRIHRLMAAWLAGRTGERTELVAQAAHHFERALALPDPARLEEPDPGLVRAAADAFLRAGDHAAAQAAHADAAIWFERAVGTLDRAGAEPPLRCRALLGLGEALLRDGAVARSRRVFAEAAAIARLHRLPDALASAALGAGGGHTFDVEPFAVDERLEVATEILALARASGDRDLALLGQRWLIVTLLELGEVEAVHREIETYTALAEELRQPYHRWFADVYRATCALLAGRLGEAGTLMQRALDTGVRVRADVAAEFYALQLFQLRDLEGRLGEMEPAIRLYEERFRDAPAHRVALALVLVETGRAEEARRELEGLAARGLADLPRDTTWAFAVACLARVAAALGDAARAEELGALLEPYADRAVVVGPATACLGSAAYYLGILAGAAGRRDDALAHLERAARANERMGARPSLARTLHAWGSLLAGSTDPAERRQAESLLARAAALFEEMGMPAPGRTDGG
jgi:class 3 adenylate cyclase/tetratricopeptide (TPR) repeat protein